MKRSVLNFAHGTTASIVLAYTKFVVIRVNFHRIAMEDCQDMPSDLSGSRSFKAVLTPGLTPGCLTSVGHQCSVGCGYPVPGPCSNHVARIPAQRSGACAWAWPAWAALVALLCTTGLFSWNTPKPLLPPLVNFVIIIYAQQHSIWHFHWLIITKFYWQNNQTLIGYLNDLCICTNNLIALFLWRINNLSAFPFERVNVDCAMTVAIFNQNRREIECWSGLTAVSCQRGCRRALGGCRHGHWHALCLIPGTLCGVHAYLEYQLANLHASLETQRRGR